MRLNVTGRRLAGLLALTLVLPAPALSQTPAPPPDPEVRAGVGAWPRPIQAGDTLIEVYQPQINSWQNNRLEARAALSVKVSGAPALSYGVIWITARTEVDKAQGLVTLEDIKVTKASFPGLPQRTSDLLRLVRQHVPDGVKVLGLAQVEANLAVAQAAPATTGLTVKNDPPRIIFSTTPALLIRIDGTPTLRTAPGSALLRVINTRSLILLDPATGQYYLYVLGRWLGAPGVTGPWTPAASVSPALESARQAAQAAGQVDLLETPPPGEGLPTIFVSTVPTELIETNGEPDWSPIPGTELLSLTNTDAHVFLELKTQLTYVLLSGRWFRARSMGGPWEYLAPNQLPADFAKIPEGHPQGMVLASVAGTPQAQEAVIANTIPQTATIVRSQARLSVPYDGTPRFAPIDGTLLQYAINTPTPVIRVDGTTYYALANGVWFAAPAPLGPWVVATVVPAVIYTVPVSSPLHYVTYVRVYGYTSTVVYVGYTPGYLGTVVTPDGVVVYGTGIVYSPWVGTVWYPPPTTYYSASSQFAWGAATGFMMGTMTGMAIGAVAWGGGCCCCGYGDVTVNKTVNNYSVNGNNVYHNTWDSKTVVSSGDKSATVYRTPNSSVVTNNQNNNVYASHDGNVYRKDDGSWQKWNSGSQSWQNVQTTRPSSTTPSAQSPPGASTPRQPSGPDPARPGGEAPGSGAPRAPGQGLGAQRGGGWFDGESTARERGFERFSGERFGGGFGGMGGFRGFRR